MPDDPHRVPLVSIARLVCAEVVRDWLRSLDAVDRGAVGQDLMRVQFQWPVGMPLCRALGDGVWEVRSNLKGGRIARVFFCFADGTLVALHGMIKKIRKTPAAELALARKRMKEFI